MANPIYGMMNGQGFPPINNPMLELVMAVKSGNPTQALKTIAAKNPKVNEALQLLNGKTPKDMENICRTLCKQRGLNFDDMITQVKQFMR